MSTKKRTLSKVVDDEEFKKKVKTANLKWKEILKETSKKKTVPANEVQHTKTLLQNRHKEKQDSKAEVRTLNRLFDILYPLPSKKTNRRTISK